MMNFKAERNRLLRLRKSELADLVLEERARTSPPREVDISTPVEAVEALAASIDEPTLDQKINLASALALADALQHGPEVSKAGVARQLAVAFSAVTDGDDAGGGLFDELDRRRREREASEARAAETVAPADGDAPTESTH